MCKREYQTVCVAGAQLVNSYETLSKSLSLCKPQFSHLEMEQHPLSLGITVRMLVRVSGS